MIGLTARLGMRLLWVPISALMLTVILWSLTIVLEPKPPIKFISSELKHKQVAPGGVVQALYTIERNRTCKATFLLGWVDMFGAPVRPPVFQPMPAGLGRIGTYTIALDVITPTTAGRYCLRSVSHHECGSDEFDMSAPEVCVEVLG